MHSKLSVVGEVKLVKVFGHGDIVDIVGDSQYSFAVLEHLEISLVAVDQQLGSN